MTLLRFSLVILILFSIKNVDGKYKLKLVLLTKCKLPENKWDKENALDVHVTSRKVSREVTVLQGNFSTSRRIGPIFMSFRTYQVKPNLERELTMRVEKMTCKQPLAMQFIKVTQIPITKDCYCEKGNYTSQPINLHDFNWILTASVVASGRYSYDLEISTDKGVVTCMSLSCDVTK